MINIDASELNRFMNCNGSYFMKPDDNSGDFDTTIRDEGNAVHWLASMLFYEFWVDSSEYLNKKAPNGLFITGDMIEHAVNYLSYIDNQSNHLTIEHQSFIAGENYRVDSRADAIGVVETSDLFIDDLKYGYTIVEPFMNWTLIYYAVDYCINKKITPPFIHFTIHQPRARHPVGNIRTWSISYEELTQYANAIFTALSQPVQELKTGNHCYKCHAFASCPARQKVEMTALETSSVVFSNDLTVDELSVRMDMIKKAIQTLNHAKKAYDEQAMHRIKNGEIIPNYSVKQSLTNRQWLPFVTPEMLQAISGLKLTKPAELITPKQAETAGLSADVTASLTVRNSKGSELVRIDANENAKKIFGKKG